MKDEKVTISATYGGVISTGPWENLRVSFSVDCTTELNGESNVRQLILEKQRGLLDICKETMSSEAAKATVERINKERGEFRFYYDDDGSPFPSVTSFLGVDKDWFVNAEKLRILAAEGQLRHALLQEWVRTGQMPDDAKNIKGVFIDYVICHKAGIHVDGHGILGFFDKYKFKALENGKKVLCRRHRYGGTPDLWAIPEDNKVNREAGMLPVLSCLDAKRTPDLHENMQQMACYIKADGRGAGQMITVPLNDKTKQGFSKPLVSQSVDKYFEMAMVKRDGFKKRYGV